MTSPHVPPGNLENIRNFPPRSDEPFFFCWFFLDPKRAFRLRLLGVANCRLSGATARLTSVSSQRSECRAHPHHISTTTHTHTQLPRKPTQDLQAAGAHTHTIPALMITRPPFFYFYFFHQICGHHFGATGYYFSFNAAEGSRRRLQRRRRQT